MTTDPERDYDNTLAELIGRAYACGFRDGWDRPSHMTVPEDLLALEEHYEKMAALRAARRAAAAQAGFVHHLDGDVRNNDLANLVIVQPEENQR